MKETSSIGLRKYELLRNEEKVLVKVPKESKAMRKVQEHVLQLPEGQAKVPSHWKNGLVLPSKKIINRHR